MGTRNLRREGKYFRKPTLGICSSSYEFFLSSYLERSTKKLRAKSLKFLNAGLDRMELSKILIQYLKFLLFKNILLFLFRLVPKVI